MLYWIGWAMFLPVFRILGRCKIIGAENVPQSGPVILAPNHISYSDPPAVGCAIKRQVHFMAKIELFRIPVLGFLIRRVGTFPVKQHTADRAALRRAGELLAEGRVLCLFPEGTRSPDGELMKPQPGLGMVALKSRAPVVPVALVGTDQLLPLHSPIMRPARVRIVFGEPMTFDDLYDQSGRQGVEQVGERVMAAIAQLQKTGRDLQKSG